MVIALLAVPAALAQVSTWGQCGGIGMLLPSGILGEVF